MKKISTLLMMELFVASDRSQTTYTWKGTNGASWETSTNWEPERSIPQSPGRLIFNTTLTVSSIPNQTVGSDNDYFTMTIGGDYIQTGGTIITDVRIGY